MSTQSGECQALPDKSTWGKELPDRMSTDFARIMARDDMPPVDETINKLYTYLLWKLDWIIDNDPWAGHGPDDPIGDLNKDAENAHRFARDDVSKFGPVMKIADSARPHYKKLIAEVDARYSTHSNRVMAEIDRGIFNFIKYTRMTATPDGVDATMKEVTLEMYLEYRAWTGGLVPCAGVVWCGEEWPKDGTVERAASAAAALNDLYDLQRDRDENSHLTVSHYFETPDEAIVYMQGYWKQVYDEANAEVKAWLNRFLVYQQDEEIQAMRGFDREWYSRLNECFY